MDPLENLPRDLDKDFARWFYGDINSLIGAQPQKDLRPIVKRLTKKPVDRIRPEAFKFLTQDLQPDQLEPIKSFDYYKFALNEEDLLASNRRNSDELPPECISGRSGKSRGGGNSRLASTQRDSARKRYTRFVEPKRSLTLTLNKESVMIDRRKMVTRSKQTNQQDDGCTSPPLIAPEEDCDDSDD